LIQFDRRGDQQPAGKEKEQKQQQEQDSQS
jgi:hypothetical protein